MYSNRKAVTIIHFFYYTVSIPKIFISFKQVFKIPIKHLIPQTLQTSKQISDEEHIITCIKNM